MRLFIAVVIFVFALAPARVAAQTACEKPYSEPRAGVSFCPPAGWEPLEVAGQEFKVLVGPKVGEATPNMLLKSVEFPGPLDEFVKGNVAELERGGRSGALQSFKLISRAEFVANNKQRGSKIVIQQVVLGNTVRQSFYSFAGADDRKLVFAYTVLAEGGEKYDPLFDESMKTLDFDAPPKLRAMNSNTERHSQQRWKE